MKTNLIIGNWKMNKTPSEAEELARAITGSVKKTRTEIVLCPSFVCLDKVGSVLKKSNVLLGSQNLHFEKSGAFTGEVSADMLKDLGVKYVLVGHSERRQFFFEDDAIVAKKAKMAVENGLTAVICVGETKDERDSGDTFDVIKRQVEVAIRGLHKDSFVIAYEPVWAIGTGVVATVEQAEEACKFIKGIVGNSVKLLYGGSMNGQNASKLLAMPSIDGGLIGGASLKVEEFLSICNN